jgi:hypothetical protein
MGGSRAMAKQVIRWGVVTVLVGIALFAIGVGLSPYYLIDHGFPFLEGDRVVRSGSAYGFTIGMTKPEVLEAIKSRYSRPRHSLRVTWSIDSDNGRALALFENTDWATYPHREHGEYRIEVTALSAMTAPLELVNEWDLELPARWVNDVYLVFSAGKLSEVQRSRWLFERP